MRAILLAFAGLFLTNCAPPGYMYDTGSFVMHPIPKQQSAFNAAHYDPDAARKNVCGNLVGQACEDAIELETTCQQYRGVAYGVFGYTLTRVPENIAMQNTISMAYGPNWQAYRGSETVEKLLAHLVAAAYYGKGLYGKTSQGFAAYAYKACKRGDPF